MAVTINKRAPIGEKIKGVRVVLDPAKTKKYPKLHAWYMKTEKIPHSEVVTILLDAGESVYTYEILDLVVPEKPAKRIVICDDCKESFIQRVRETIMHTYAKLRPVGTRQIGPPIRLKFIRM